MPENAPRFYLTTPIYYVNARPHIGHAYSTIAADVIARRHRLLGPPPGADGLPNTFFLTGTDEHGQKVQRSAEKAVIPPQQFADEVSKTFSDLWKRMGITNDDYIRTTDERHKRGVQKLWRHLEERGAIYLSSYTGQYSVGEEMFIDGPPGTIGPDGKPTETVTEENYFFRLSDYQLPLLDLIESGKLHIQPETTRNEVLSFLRGNLVGAAGMASVNDPGALEQGLSFAEINEGLRRDKLRRSAAGSLYVPGALKDLSISRTTFNWGIPVPGNDKHVIYVWLDALANYMTAVGYGSDDPADIAKFEKYWPADLHLVGKEITRFHCVYWPAFLLAAGLPLPKSVVANGWLLFEDSKMSKSRGNVVRTETILDAFGSLKPKPADLPGAVLSDEAWKHEQDLFASDVIRYFLLREIPFGQDGSFSFDALVQRYNSDLANGYGNLVSRTLSMLAQYRGGTVPIVSENIQQDVTDLAWAEETMRSVPASIGNIPQITTDYVRASSLITRRTVAKGFDEYEFGRITEAFKSAVSITDAYISSREPWKLAKLADKASEAKLDETLYVALESIRLITVLIHPILPHTTMQVWLQLGLDPTELTTTSQHPTTVWGGLKPGTKLGQLAPIFPRAPKELIQLMTDMETPATPPTSKLVDEKTNHSIAAPADSTHPGAAPSTSSLPESNPGATVGGSSAIITERPVTPSHTEAPASGPFAASAAASTTPDTPQIAIDDFVKIDLRVARIVVAERIPKADKLLRLEVDLGYEKRQILSGIAEWYTPEELIGRRIVVIANLAPRKMRGLESHGMLLAASNGEAGKPILATFADSEEIELGSRLK
jgi:methionyl-tRNA synthetase